MSAVLVTMPDSSMAWLDPAPLPLGDGGHAWDVPGVPAGWCLLCGAHRDERPGPCPEGDAQRTENELLADYVARNRVEGVRL